MHNSDLVVPFIRFREFRWFVMHESIHLRITTLDGFAQLFSTLHACHCYFEELSDRIVLRWDI